MTGDSGPVGPVRTPACDGPSGNGSSEYTGLLQEESQPGLSAQLLQRERGKEREGRNVGVFIYSSPLLVESAKTQQRRERKREIKDFLVMSDGKRVQACDTWVCNHRWFNGDILSVTFHTRIESWPGCLSQRRPCA